jgi:outer membrane immunogenic protein
MKQFVLAGIIVAGVGSAASAADMPAKAYGPPPAAFSWTGLYIGASAGVARSQGLRGDDCTSVCSGIDAVVDGATAGGQIGYNWQQGNALIGVEADFSWIDGDRKISLCSAGCGTALDISTKRQFIGTVRGRMGLVVHQTLAYVTGGFAYSDGEDTAQARDTPGPTFSAQSYKLNYGWVVGGGIEQAWSRNWTVRLEGLYHSFGSKEFTYVDPAAFFNPTPIHATSSVITARVGVNYRFGGGGF